MSNSTFFFEIGTAIFSFLAGAIVSFYTLFKKSKIKLNSQICNKFTRIHSSINEILTELRVNTKSCRTNLVQFHNGGNFLDGSSILKFSITHESCDLGTSTTIDSQQATLLTRFTDKLEYLQENNSNIIKTKEMNSSHFRNYMQSRNVVAFIMLPIHCEKKINIIGYITIEWCELDFINNFKEDHFKYESKIKRNILTELLYKQKNI